MKKSIVITTIIIALIVSVGGGLWLKTRLNAQAVAEVAQEQKQEQPKSKYDVGPADPTELLELVNAERQRVGVAPLEFDESMQRSAQLKANDMITKDYRQHIIPGLGDMYTQEMRYLIYQRAKCSHSSENYYTGAYHPKSDVFVSTSREAFNGWMSSKPPQRSYTRS